MATPFRDLKKETQRTFVTKYGFSGSEFNTLYNHCHVFISKGSLDDYDAHLLKERSEAYIRDFLGFSYSSPRTVEERDARIERVKLVAAEMVELMRYVMAARGIAAKKAEIIAESDGKVSFDRLEDMFHMCKFTKYKNEMWVKTKKGYNLATRQQEVSSWNGEYFYYAHAQKIQCPADGFWDPQVIRDAMKRQMEEVKADYRKNEEEMAAFMAASV